MHVLREFIDLIVESRANKRGTKRDQLNDLLKGSGWKVITNPIKWPKEQLEDAMVFADWVAESERGDIQSELDYMETPDILNAEMLFAEAHRELKEENDAGAAREGAERALSLVPLKAYKAFIDRLPLIVTGSRLKIMHKNAYDDAVRWVTNVMDNYGDGQDLRTFPRDQVDNFRFAIVGDVVVTQGEVELQNQHLIGFEDVAFNVQNGHSYELPHGRGRAIVWRVSQGENIPEEMLQPNTTE